jgi:DnaD/phage-associated family protein
LFAEEEDKTMAKKVKDSFIIFYEWEDSLRNLSDEQMGQVFRALFAYEKRGEVYDGDDPAVEIAMNFLRFSLDRNREKYEEICKKRSLAGQKGGAPAGNQNARKLSQTSKTSKNNQNQTKQAEHDPDRDRDSVREPEPEPDPEHEHEPDRDGVRTADAVAFFQEHIYKKMTWDNKQAIQKYCEEMGADTVLRAMKVTEQNGGKGWRYCEAILKNWRKERKHNGDSGEPADGSGTASRWGSLPGIKRL